MTCHQLVVCESQIDYAHFVRTLKVLVRQPEFRDTGGSLTWFIIFQLRWILWHLRIKRTKPLLFTVEQNGRVVGGFTLNRTGEIGNVILEPDCPVRLRVMKLLARRIDALIGESDRPLQARTLESNTSIVRALKRRGFSLSDEVIYVLTLPLGPLTISWLASTPPHKIENFVEVRILRLLKRPKR